MGTCRTLKDVMKTRIVRHLNHQVNNDVEAV